MRMMTVQPEKVVPNLMRATVPAYDVPPTKPEPVTVSSVILMLLLLPPRAIVFLGQVFYGAMFHIPAAPAKSVIGVGIPHGVENLPVRMRYVRVGANGTQLAYCESHSYEALEPVTMGDEECYPTGVDTDAECPIPQDGYYSVLAHVSVNGRTTVRIKSFEPECVNA